MTTPEGWNALITAEVPTARFRERVAHCARMYLASLEEGVTISTEQLVEHLYPRAIADQTLAGDTARKRIYMSLAKLAPIGLEDCCVKGEVNGQFMGKPKRPWRWFSPGPVDVCCMCGQIVQPAEE